MLREIFQDCVCEKSSWYKIIKNCIIIQVLPIVSDKKIYPIIRLMQITYRYKLYPLMLLFRYIIFEQFNCIISQKAQIGKQLKFPHPLGIVIGENVKIGSQVTIYQNVTLGQNLGYYPEVGDNVIIYANAVIIGNVKIGNNAIIGANSVVIQDIPDNAIVAGCPAKIIKYNSSCEGRYY